MGKRYGFHEIYFYRKEIVYKIKVMLRNEIMYNGHCPDDTASVLLQCSCQLVKLNSKCNCLSEPERGNTRKLGKLLKIVEVENQYRGAVQISIPTPLKKIDDPHTPANRYALYDN